MSNISEAVISNIMVNKWMRRYNRWRFLGICFLLSILTLFFFHVFNKKNEDRLIRLTLSGEIGDISPVHRAFNLLDDKNIKGVLVLANSPGGVPSVSEAWSVFFKALQSKNIPVITVVQDVCASGCYLAIKDSKKIIAYNSSLIGSIGAVMVAPDFSSLVKKMNIKFNVFKSGKLKGEPNPLVSSNDEVEKYSLDLVQSLGKWFVQEVMLARNIQDKNLYDLLSSGQVFIAKDALNLNLIDVIADEVYAISLLRKEVGNDKIELVDVDLSEQSYLSGLLGIKDFKNLFLSVFKNSFGLWL